MLPTCVVKGDVRTSMPTTSWAEFLSVRTSASPRCPALPVTRILILRVPAGTRNRRSDSQAEDCCGVRHVTLSHGVARNHLGKPVAFPFQALQDYDPEISHSSRRRTSRCTIHEHSRPC